MEKFVLVSEKAVFLFPLPEIKKKSAFKIGLVSTG